MWIINFKNIINKIPKHFWMLGLIIIIGIFLRTYKLHDWLYFYPDQARDVAIVDGVISGQTSWPLLGFKAASTDFQLGAMYSYFQIISAKIFGSSPTTVAYPDVFFGILSIPLLYYFLRKYFSINIALAVSGLYSLSFYAIRYSRFAWNSNPIPFFIILFLLSLHEFIFNKSKTHWGWIALVGLTLGVGVQLHTVLLVLLPIICFLTFIYIIKYDREAWKKWVIIFLIAIVLNAGQLISEIKTEFKNTSSFFSVLNDRSPSESRGIANNLVLNVICQAQAGASYLVSLENNDDCDNFSHFKYNAEASQNKLNYGIRLVNISFGLILFLAGYILLIYYARKERDEKKKIFLYFNLIYGALAFLVILPIITHNGMVRYWLPIIFIPFLFLSLIGKYFSEKFSKKYHWFGILVIIFLITANFNTIITETRQFASKSRSNSTYVVLGELEEIESYIETQSFPQKKAHIYGGQKYMQNFYNPLSYIASKNNFITVRVWNHPERVPAGEPFFFVTQSSNIERKSINNSGSTKLNLEIENYKGFGNIGIYKIKN